MKIVHAADLHIDSPLKGLDRYAGAPVDRLRGATRRALENLVALCVEERVDVLLLAGDVFDGTWKDYSTGLFFASQMTRLREAKIPVVIVRGNHDAVSSVVKALRLPENVKELSPRKPETFELRDAGIAVHGQGFSQRSVTEDLAARYPERVPGLFNIGLLHTSIDGRPGHDAYAPTSFETMRAKGYDYWALGHVHAREIVSTDPYIVYPGNLQGRHARETGPKGATIITTADNVVESVEHRPLDVFRWELVTVDASVASDALEVVDRVRASVGARARDGDGRVLAARVIVSGSTRANTAIRRDEDRFVNEVRAAVTDGLGELAWLEKVIVQTTSHVDLASLREEATAVGHLARRLAVIRESPEDLADIATLFADLDRRLPAELREGEGALRLTDPATIRALIDDVEQMLVPRLLEPETRATARHADRSADPDPRGEA